MDRPTAPGTRQGRINAPLDDRYSVRAEFARCSTRSPAGRRTVNRPRGGHVGRATSGAEAGRRLWASRFSRHRAVNASVSWCDIAAGKFSSSLHIPSARPLSAWSPTVSRLGTKGRAASVLRVQTPPYTSSLRIIGIWPVLRRLAIMREISPKNYGKPWGQRWRMAVYSPMQDVGDSESEEIILTCLRGGGRSCRSARRLRRPEVGGASAMAAL